MRFSPSPEQEARQAAAERAEAEFIAQGYDIDVIENPERFVRESDFSPEQLAAEEEDAAEASRRIG